MKDWIITDYDRDLFERELQSFVPTRVFDAHVHLYLRDHFPPDDVPELFRGGPARIGAEEFTHDIAQLIPGREMDGLFFAFPKVGMDLAAANGFIAREVTKLPRSRGQMVVTPDLDPEFIRESVRSEGFVGLKCYHVFARSQPTFEAPIEDFLPEEQARIAHEEGLSITLHLVRARALADLGNQETIRRYCRRYPDMRLILAHAARGFNPHHTIEGIDALAGLDNLWFDTAAVTDSGALEVIIRKLGHHRLLYGSDFPVTHIRGRCVAIGDSFVWLSVNNLPREVLHAKVRPTMIGLESLRTLKVAALASRLTDAQIEDVFYNNASGLYELGRDNPRLR